ncbi:MAG TPA: 6-phosphofructokinase, partial [Bacteroidales bacterium]|nr:6-phosphofructokinase [Bacteroidales bacterium]
SHPEIIAVPLTEALDRPNFVNPDCSLVRTARGLGISFGD